MSTSTYSVNLSDLVIGAILVSTEVSIHPERRGIKDKDCCRWPTLAFGDINSSPASNAFGKGKDFSFEMNFGVSFF